MEYDDNPDAYVRQLANWAAAIRRATFVDDLTITREQDNRVRVEVSWPGGGRVFWYDPTRMVPLCRQRRLIIGDILRAREV